MNKFFILFNYKIKGALMRSIGQNPTEKQIQLWVGLIIILYIILSFFLYSIKIRLMNLVD